MNIQIIVFDGVDELDFVGPFEVFQRAGRDNGATTTLVTTVLQEQITGAHGLRVRPDGVAGKPVDLLIVPGGGWASKAALGIRREIDRGVLPALIEDAHAAGAIIAGVCTGAMAIAAAGLLDNRTAVTHANALDDLRAAGARIVDARVVDDDDIVTCGGVTSGIDLALWLVERFWGDEAAAKVARQMEYRQVENVLRVRRPADHMPDRSSNRSAQSCR